MYELGFFYMTMEVYRIARILRELILIHDKAVKQINLLDNKISAMTYRMMKLQTDDEMSIAFSILDQRRSIVEFVRDMYHIYRLSKWQQISKMVSSLWGGYVPTDINNIISLAMMEYADSVTSDEEMNSSVLEEEMMVDERVI